MFFKNFLQFSSVTVTSFFTPPSKFFFNFQVSRLKKPDEKSGLGISLEGTVDVEGGKEVRPHHYIR